MGDHTHIRWPVLKDTQQHIIPFEHPCDLYFDLAESMFNSSCGRRQIDSFCIHLVSHYCNIFMYKKVLCYLDCCQLLRFLWNHQHVQVGKCPRSSAIVWVRISYNYMCITCLLSIWLFRPFYFNTSFHVFNHWNR